MTIAELRKLRGRDPAQFSAAPAPPAAEAQFVDPAGHTFSPSIKQQQKELNSKMAEAPALAAKAKGEFERLYTAGFELRDAGDAEKALLVQEYGRRSRFRGDADAPTCREGGTTLALTQDHKPELDPEKKRIEALGGFVSYIGCWRAMGILAMSRAIGDLFLKPYALISSDLL